MKLLIDNSQCLFIVVTSTGHSYVCNLSQISSVIVTENLNEGYYKIYELWNNKLKYVSRERLKNLYTANKIDQFNLIVSVNIDTKGYRDITFGKNYIAGIVTTNFGLPSEKNFAIPYQSGGKDMALKFAQEVLSENGVLPKFGNSSDGTDYIRHNGMCVSTSHADGYKKYELKMIG